MNLRQLFDLSLVNRRDEVALEWAGAEYTFGDIDARSNRMAQCAPGARASRRATGCAVYLANRIEMIDIYLACVKLGVIFVPINILYREREMSHILERRGAEAVHHRSRSSRPGGRSRRGNRTGWKPCRSKATLPRRWSIPPAPPEPARARFSRTTISPPTR